MGIPSGPFYIDDLLTWTSNTHTVTTGAATDADSVPTYLIYEDETGTAIATGSMAKLDDANTLGFYSEQITLSAANGYEVGKSYSIYISSTVNSVTATKSENFKVIATPTASLDAAGIRAAVGLASANLDTQLLAIDDAIDTEVGAIKTKTDFLPSVTAGAAGGLFIAGTNAATTVTTSFTSTFTGNLTGSVASVTGNVTGSVGSVATGGITTGSFAAGAINNTAIATDAIGAAEFAADAVGEIADAVWNEFVAAGLVITSSSAAAGSSSTITLDSGASATDNLYNGLNVTIAGGTGVGQTRTITGYVGSTKVATVHPNWTTNPAAASLYTITPNSGTNVTTWRASTPNQLQTGRVDVSVGAMAADTLTASALATDAVTEIQTGLATAAALTVVDDFLDTEVAAIKVTTDKLDTALELDGAVYRYTTNALEQAPTGGGASAATIADAVWDEVTSGHVTADTFGKLIADINTQVDTEVAAILAAVDTEVAAIKTKTDFLPSATAGAAGGLFVAGTNAATTITTALTTTFTGNLTGSVGSVTGAVGSVTGSVGSVTGAVGSVTGNVGGNVTGSVGSIATGGITTGSFAAGAINAAAIATDAIGAAELAADAITEIQAGLATSAALTVVDDFLDTEIAAIKTVTDKLDTAMVLDGAVYQFTVNALELGPTGSGASAASIADAVWDEVLSGHLTAGTTGAALDASGGGVTAAAIADAVWDEAVSGHAVAGSFGAQITTIDDFLDTEVAAILAAVDTEVAAIKTKTDFLPSVTAGAAGGLFIAGTNAATVITGSLTTTFTGNLTGSVASVTGAVGSVTGSVGTVNAFAANSITAAATAADYVTEIQSGLATAAALTVVDDFLDTEVAAIKVVTDKLDTAMVLDGAVYQFTVNALELGPSGSGASAASIADAVWDEVLSGHLTAGTTGAALNGAGGGGGGGSAADVWNEPTAGYVTAGTFGKLVADINAKTTNLPPDPADASDISASFAAIELAVDNVDEVADAVWAVTERTLTANTNLDIPDAAAIRDAVGLALPSLDAQFGLLPTAAENATELFTQVDGVEPTITFRYWLRLAGSSLFGKASGLDTTFAAYRDVSDTKDRIVATVDDNGNRISVALDPF